MTSSLAAGKTASISISRKTAPRPCWARNPVTACASLLLLAEREARELVHRPDVAPGDHAGDVGAGERLRPALQRRVPAQCLDTLGERTRRHRADDRPARGLDPQRHARRAR